MWLLLRKRCFFPDKWTTYLSFLHQICVALIWLKQSKNQCVCVRCTTSCVCIGGRAGSSREKGISPWNTGVTPAAVPEGAGRICSLSPFNTVISNCWSKSKILTEWSKHAWIAKQWFFSRHLSLWNVEFPIPHLSHSTEISRIPPLEYQWWCENTWEWEPRAPAAPFLFKTHPSTDRIH